MRLSRAVLALCPVLAVAACGSGPRLVPVVKVVHENHAKAVRAYVHGVRSAAAAPCPASASRAAVATVNDLIGAFNQEEAWGRCGARRAQMILKRPAPVPATS